ncbi:conserved hypothetical protein [Perkinsus marinus ATCC 50983]|uniref:ELMO domain-containing protein n=1 Tax=Perkinsus marinus (strain ATCC 50983 / TXsc) TaxID=423536 RepID=C5LJK7_PERM5|nr:conserved hypothetical protein [Perkinsus marinus ATCC 50983]EER03136.1 conserved hypothetical protein [Perkinsus marinus ATCC 50983]|eukprot:XP_002771320.1 conserved hypothetical protein [Perkinsus marinus ATCC 50983]
MSSLAVVSPSGGTTVLPIQAHYEAMEGPAAHQPSSSHTTASCGGPVTADVGSAPPELPRDERWKAVGFQSACPSTDLRTGPHALLCMVQAARAYTSEFREMVAVSDGYCLMDFNQFHYPFAATAINVHFMLLHYLGIVDGFSPVTKDAIVASGYERKVFASALALTNGAFEDLFTATCMAVHSHWTRMVADEGATLMDFQESLAFGLSEEHVPAEVMTAAMDAGDLQRTKARA